MGEDDSQHHHHHHQAQHHQHHHQAQHHQHHPSGDGVMQQQQHPGGVGQHHHPFSQPPIQPRHGSGRQGGHERENLRHIIQQWNANRLDLFEISEPDENLHFTGVMRFYFQDSGQKVATKCIRVASSETTKEVIATLVEKFRPDMRMLSAPSYLLYEIHENGVGSPSAEERRLADDEKPLLVQLNWNKDDREGRFLLRRVDIAGKVQLPPLNSSSSLPKESNGSNFIRKLSRREKKDLKRQEKQRRAATEAAGEDSVAEKLYTELPETSFTRSISNPEAVMRRRRAQKLERKLQQFRSKDGGPDTGGTLKIYGSSLCPDVPYKTLLLSVRDTAHSVVKEMLEKYGLYREHPANYCLIQAVVTAEEAREGYEGPVYPQKEYILDDDECPLAILMNHSTTTGSIMFHVRRRPADHGPRKRKKKPLKGSGQASSESSSSATDPHNRSNTSLPVLVELGPEGNELGGSGSHHVLQPNVTEVGSERSSHTSAQLLQLFGPDIHPRHCILAHTDGVVIVTPCNRDAEVAVNGHRIAVTTILKHGSVVRFGRHHSYRFLDPQQDPRVSSRLSNLHQQQPPPQQHYPDRGQLDRYPVPRDPILPAVLEFREDSEDTFFHNITTALDPTDVQFKLAPTYTLYMAARFRASTHYRPELPPMDRAQRLTVMLSKVAALLHNVIQSRPGQPLWLAFWLANCSELLHFLKQDRHIAGYSLDAQDRLAEVVQIAFRALVVCMQSEMEGSLPLLLEDRDDADEEEGCSAHVLSILSNTMALLRRCRVNAALTIQLFSQLFHFINMWAFNRVVQPHFPNYCTKVWGARLRVRLSRIEVWAEKQGLELAADCHLARLSQAAILLTAAKSCPEDIASISSSCFKLNSLQLRALLDNYMLEPGEPPIPHDLRDSIVAVAESTADGLARVDGREVRLEEDYELQLPFLLPEDGYSCDIVRGVPSGLEEFLLPLQNAGLCRMNPQATSSGFWTIYMVDHDTSRIMQPGARSPSVMSSRSLPRGEPEVHTLHLHKTSQGMGLSIVATRGLNQEQLGIYIKSVVPGGSADQDGRLQAGDQLLSVDGRSLVGISQERAAEYMKRTGPTVVLEVARQGAFYHGLATVLEQPSPQGTRPSIVSGGPQRHASERDIRAPHEQPSIRGSMLPPPPHHPSSHIPRMQPAKSVPALNSELSVSGELSKSSSHDPSRPQQQPPHPQDIFNPNYSRTSSSNSLTPHQQPSTTMAPVAPQQQQQTGPSTEHQPLQLRSRSTQNLTETDDRHYQNVSFHAPPPRRSPHAAAAPPPHLRENPSQQPRPASALLQRDDVSRGEGFRPDLYRPASQRDVRQHEPRLVHLPEEPVPSSAPRQPYYQQHQPQPVLGASAPSKPAPPPTAPKPKSLDRNIIQHHQQQPSSGLPYRQPHPDDGNNYRDSPPPPPPPVSTHPLLQVSPSNESTTRQPFFSKTSAWEREEKERYEKRRREAARHWRDEQITLLEQQEHKTPQEVERLKTLQLEREFELRAKQAVEEEENSDEDDERITDMVEPRNISENIVEKPETNKPTVPRGGPGFMAGVNGGSVADEERTKRADEIKRKQQELDVASEVEQRLLREAQRRQEEEAIARRYQHQYKNSYQQASQRLDSLVSAPVADSANGPVNGLRQHNSLDLQNSINNNPMNPAPPERTSSYNVMQQQYPGGSSNNNNNSNMGRPRVASLDSSPPSANIGVHINKRVQFSESHVSNTSILDVSVSSTVSYDDNANQQQNRSPTKYDPNDFINEAENMLNFSPSPIRGPGAVPATPGVIGAQEVYRDPRVRQLQEKMALQAASNIRAPVPETLTFREKMKMFAAETGDPDTPKDRTKISRAQREID
uniref:Afadin-like n=1 Tax=Hirondellea gigas TaxID=1518452 RepID=A0A6A7FPY9_9CRUS